MCRLNFDEPHMVVTENQTLNTCNHVFVTSDIFFKDEGVGPQSMPRHRSWMVCLRWPLWWFTWGSTSSRLRTWEPEQWYKNQNVPLMDHWQVYLTILCIPGFNPTETSAEIQKRQHWAFLGGYRAQNNWCTKLFWLQGTSEAFNTKTQHQHHVRVDGEVVLSEVVPSPDEHYTWNTFLFNHPIEFHCVCKR